MSRVSKVGLQRFGGTGRAYKREFRARLRKLEKAVGEYRICCAYTPIDAYVALQQVEKNLRIMRKAMSAKEWGR